MRHSIPLILVAFLLIAAKTCTAAVDHYMLRFGPQPVSVTVQGVWDTQTVTVQWREHGRPQRQQLAVPKRWVPMTRDDNAGMSGIIPFAPGTGQKSFIVVMVSKDYLPWEYRSPGIYVYSRHQWRLQNRDLWKEAFSSAGSFYTRGRILHVWDIEYDLNTCHHCAQKFSLRRFIWRQGRLQSLDKRITRKKYEWIYNYELIMDGKTLSPDPLREFGLRWRWWGTRT